MNPNLLLSKKFILSVFLLLLNDFYLKAHYPSIITGKLSDFAGLFAFVIFFSEVFKNKKNWVYITTALGFIVWKMPITNEIISFWNKFMPYPITRVVDYTDYIALLILPIAYYYTPRKEIKILPQFKNGIIISVTSIAIFSFLATAGGHGNIKLYEIKYSKSEVNEAITFFLHKYPEQKVPKRLESYTWHYGPRDTQDKWIIEANADSVSYHFYFSKPEMIIWAGVTGFSDDWHKKSCEIALEGYVIPGQKWNFSEDLSDEEQDKVTLFFEKEILSKLDSILKNRE